MYLWRPQGNNLLAPTGGPGADAIDALSHGINVAAVFAVKRGAPLPEKYLGYHVIDGDAHDLRFLDGTRVPVIVGLRAKGQAKHDTLRFVQITL